MNLQGGCTIEITKDIARQNEFYAIELETSREKHIFFRFNKIVLSTRKSNPIYRWIQSVPLIVDLVRKVDFVPGKTKFFWSDAASDPGLAFCSKSRCTTLIPDRDFATDHGYESFKALVPSFPAWGTRRSAAMWRGTLWNIEPGGWRSQQRTRLCELSLSPQFTHLLDAGFTESNSFEMDEIQAAGLAKPRIASTQLCYWKYLIDIDGYSNSWFGLFTKLCSGSVVLKVTSDFKQWYYDRLQPWVNFVPVASDLSDLLDIIIWLRDNDHAARQVGERGQQLALSMSYESELVRVSDKVSLAFKQGSDLALANGCKPITS